VSAIAQIAAREWNAIRSERRFLWLILTASVVFVLSLAWIYSPRKLLRIPVLIVDQDHSRISRELTSAILANETFSLGGYAESGDVFPTYVAQDRVHICFVFPRGLERALLSRQPAQVEVLVDNSNYLAGKSQINSAMMVLSTFSVGTELRTLQAMYGIKQPAAQSLAMPYEIGTRMWFNPPLNANHLNFMVGGLVYIVIQLCGLFLSIRSGAADLTWNHKAELRKMTRGVWTLLAGKLLPYGLLALPLSVALMMMPHVFFGTPLIWASLSLWIVLFWYVLMLVMLGFGLSCLAKDPLFATEMCASITMPNFLLTGYTWPLFAMPGVVRFFAYALPMSPASFMMRKISLMGGSLADCGNQLAVLAAWTLAALFLAWRGARAILAEDTGGPLDA
jgi:ABC-2 type transport system permease protein